MNKEECLALIQFYGSQRLLWDSKCPDFSNKRLRNEAWSFISREMNIPEDILKKKMESLQGSYRREKSRIRSSLISGSGRADVYKSKWYAYEAFSFMADKNDPGTTQDAGYEQVWTEEEETQSYELPSYEIPSSETPTPSERHSIRTNKNLIKHPVTTDTQEEEAYQFMKKAAYDLWNRDESSIFGQMIAAKLRKLSPRNRAVAENRIHNVIFDLEIQEIDSGLQTAVAEGSLPS